MGIADGEGKGTGEERRLHIKHQQRSLHSTATNAIAHSYRRPVCGHTCSEVYGKENSSVLPWEKENGSMLPR
ncbi:hypothetical protein RHMOL_Rhmol10G0289500 [Rhododendron molle]|uniref:Uncharacterized protein n=1 Tax=Rhododendron molle TaxID=49168 RepID=A0ACC0M7Q9_RHOML|nr:hypothetical protein RHMOL_Rhmol10G0289500 [Rhododendron molle]